MDYTKKTILIGAAGELRVRSELLLREISAAVFDQDLGVDIITDKGKRIQVKTSLKPIHDKKSYSYRYSFSVRQPQVRVSKKGSGLYEKRYTRRDYKNVVDFFIFWCVRDNLFYIVPEKDVGQKISIVMATPIKKRKYKKHTWKKSVSKYEKYRDNWDQLK